MCFAFRMRRLGILEAGLIKIPKTELLGGSVPWQALQSGISGKKHTP